MNYFIADSHTDFMTTIKCIIKREEYIKQCAQNGVKILGCAIFTTEYNFTVEDIKNFKVELENLSNKYGVKLLLCIEDIGFIKTSDDLERLIELKPFSVSLTWNYLNQYAGGANSNDGLTILGKKTIKVLEDNSILVDTAHLSRRAFDDFVKITTLPIYNSHSNIFSLHPHQRNLTDGQIQQIVDSGGYLGLTIYSKFISNNQISSADIAKQFDYLINNFGVDNFGVGSDLYGFDFKYCPADVKSYTDFANIAEGLRSFGYKQYQICKIMCDNFKRFYNKCRQ